MKAHMGRMTLPAKYSNEVRQVVGAAFGRERLCLNRFAAKGRSYRCQALGKAQLARREYLTVASKRPIGSTPTALG